MDAYLAQRDVDGEAPMLAFDTETEFTDPSNYDLKKTGKKKISRVPLPIWEGSDYNGKVRIVQIGLDPLNTSFAIRNRQFVFDVKLLGADHVSAALKHHVENSYLLMANGKYDRGHCKVHFDWDLGVKFPIVDTMLTGQVALAGDRVRHGLIDHAKEFVGQAMPGLFEEVIGQSLFEYGHRKTDMQQSRWDGDLSKDQLRYAKNDGVIPFLVYQAQQEIIDGFTEKWERGFNHDYSSFDEVLDDPRKRGLCATLSLEYRLIPFFSDLEVNGMKFDRRYYETYVIPLMESMMWEAEDLCHEIPEFRIRREGEEKELVFYWSGDDNQLEEFKINCKKLKHLVKIVFRNISDLSIRSKKAGGQRELRLSWIGKPQYESMRGFINSFSSLNNFALRHKPERVINFGSHDQVKARLKSILGFKIDNCRQKYLKSLINADDPKTKAIEYLLRYKKAKNFFDKYGRNLLNYVTDRNYVHMIWNQIGSESNEIVSGRSSAQRPAVMQMAARDVLYAWSLRMPGGVHADELLRSAWIAEDDCVILACDLSNIEPRMTAQRTRDKTLISIFKDGLDQHLLTGMKVLGLKVATPKFLTPEDAENDAVNPEYDYVRNTVGKIVNLGLSYGMGAKGLAEFLYDKTNGKIDWRSKKDINKAQSAIDAYFELYAGIAKLIAETDWKTTRRLRDSGTLAAWRGRRPFGVVHSILGRPRRFCILKEHESNKYFTEDMLSEDYNPTDKHFYYNEFKRRINKVRLAAYNHLIQSSAADVLKIAELKVWRKLQEKYKTGEFDPSLDHCKLVVHDEIVAQAQRKNAAAMAKIIYDSMIEAGKLFIKVVPVECTIGCGENWYRGKKTELDMTDKVSLRRSLNDAFKKMDERKNNESTSGVAKEDKHCES